MLQWKGKMAHSGESNRAVLVSVAEFDQGVQLRRRPGAKRDAKRLHRTLSKLGFKVDIYTDLSSEEIYELFQKGNTHDRWEHGSSTTLQRTCFTLFIHLISVSGSYLSC